jgi:hypothetical protein
MGLTVSCCIFHWRFCLEEKLPYVKHKGGAFQGIINFSWFILIGKNEALAEKVEQMDISLFQSGSA